MTPEAQLLDSALRAWNTNVDRTGKFFNALTEEQLLSPVAPGKNRLIYLWGHLTAVHDALLPLLDFGPRLHPELDTIFVTNPDQAVPVSLTGTDLARIWEKVNLALATHFASLTPAQWLERHTSVSPEDFAKDPSRNRYTILLGRTVHMAYHLGQAKLWTAPK